MSPEAVAASRDEARNLIRASDCDCDEGEGLNGHAGQEVSSSSSASVTIQDQARLLWAA